ncbi:MAG: permease [Actinomycetota bacterium]
MIFLQILQTFRGFAIDILPLFIIALVVSSVFMEYFSFRSLDRLMLGKRGRTTFTSTLFAVFLPVTPVCRIPMAASIKRYGAGWPYALAFVGAGAGASLPALIITFMISWQFAALRVIAALAFLIVLPLIVRKVLEPRFSSRPLDFEIKSLFNQDFCEVSYDYINKDNLEPKLSGAWQNFLKLARITLPWLVLSLFIASLVYVIVPSEAIRAILGGKYTALKTSLLGFPFYFALGLEVPILFVLLKKGMDMGAAVSLMLAAPVVNFPVLSTLGRWLGYKKAVAFIFCCWLAASAIGVFFSYVG